MTDEKRPYKMKRRAELENQTRLRITESAIELHGTLGPSQTSISALAEYAGVRRSTIYRHFPDEAALFASCTSHWQAANPLPELRRWSAVTNADERLRIALRELYAHYRRTQRMMENVLRDEATMPIVKRMLAGYRQYLTEARDRLMEGHPLEVHTRRRTRAAIGHALDFHTWRSLAIEQGLDDVESADLMSLLVAAAGQPRQALSNL